MRELKPLFTTVFVMVFALMGLSAVMSMGKSISKMIQGVDVSPQGGAASPTPTEVPSPAPSPPTTTSAFEPSVPDPIKWGTVGTVLIIIAAVIVGFPTPLPTKRTETRKSACFGSKFPVRCSRTGNSGCACLG